MDFKDKLKNARPHTLTVEICLRGDLVAEIERLDRELVAAGKTPAAGMEDGARLREIAERIEAIRDEMAADENSHTFAIQALPGPKYRALKAEHPPRLDEDGRVDDRDRIIGANIDAIAEPLVRACIVDPVLDDATWEQVNNALTDGQFDKLFLAALKANGGEVSIPFSRAASLVMRSTAPE